jgi:thymidylate synthase (FAD)
MKIIHAPSVYLLACQTILDSELNRFLADHGVAYETDTGIASERLVEVAGRICYMSFSKPRPGGNEAYIDRILESRHGSVTEHAVWTILVTGVSRSLSHEFVRHRLASYSQLSQRYVDESTAEYVEPHVVANDPACHAIFMEAVAHAHAAYIKLVERLNEVLSPEMLKCKTCDGKGEFVQPGGNEPYPCGDCKCSGRDAGRDALTALRKESRQAARSVLPNATETKLTVTMNARAWRHFLEMRCSRHADREIRVLAGMIYKLLLSESEHLFGDYTECQLPDGTFEIKTPNLKV